MLPSLSLRIYTYIYNPFNLSPYPLHKKSCHSVFTPRPDPLPIDIEEIRHRHHKRTDRAEDGDGVVHPEVLVEGDCYYDHAAISKISTLPNHRRIQRGGRRAKTLEEEE